MATLTPAVALPKSTAGRRAKPLDEKFSAALLKAIQTTPVVDGRPAFHATSDRFETKGKASADGRRYANAVAEKLGADAKVSVRVFEDGKQFGWGIYVPLASSDNAASE